MGFDVRHIALLKNLRVVFGVTNVDDGQWPDSAASIQLIAKSGNFCSCFSIIIRQVSASLRLRAIIVLSVKFVGESQAISRRAAEARSGRRSLHPIFSHEKAQ